MSTTTNHEEQQSSIAGVVRHGSSEIVRQEPDAHSVYSRMADPMAAIKEMGSMFAASGMFGCTKLEQGQVLALACLIEGKSPFELMRNYHIIGGNLSMRSSAVLAEFLKKGGRCTWKSALNNTDEARADFAMGDNVLSDAAYTIEDAKREKLVGGTNPNWSTRPADMLRARLITKAIRMIAPGIVMGITDESEASPAAPPPPLLEPKQETPLEKTDKAALGLQALDTMLEEVSIDPKDAVAFLVSIKLLKEGEGLDDLSKPARTKAQRNFPEFAAKVKDFIKERDA